jgi:hypothetical protein
MEIMTMTNERIGTMSKLLDVLGMVKITPSCEILENADLLTEAVANLRIRVGQEALDAFVRLS